MADGRPLSLVFIIVSFLMIHSSFRTLSNRSAHFDGSRLFSLLVIVSSFLFKASSLCLSLPHSTTYYLFSILLAKMLFVSYLPFPVHLFNAYLVQSAELAWFRL